jgi:hypothetical protein
MEKSDYEYYFTDRALAEEFLGLMNKQAGYNEWELCEEDVINNRDTMLKIVCKEGVGEE